MQNWARRIGRLSLWIAIAGLAVAGVGLTLARYDVIAKMPGFQAMIYGGMAEVGALVLGIIALILSIWGGSSGRKSAVVGCLLALPLIIFLGNGYQKAKSVPPLHDITTDPANPPQFKAITLRADNLAGVKTEANWRKMMTDAYPDIKPITIDRPAPEVMKSVRALAEQRKWKIVEYDLEGGRLEAVAPVSYIRFYDDVLVLVTPGPDEQSSVVNMRSVSEVGVSDLGVNAARIRSFLTDLGDMSGDTSRVGPVTNVSSQNTPAAMPNKG